MEIPPGTTIGYDPVEDKQRFRDAGRGGGHPQGHESHLGAPWARQGASTSEPARDSDRRAVAHIHTEAVETAYARVYAPAGSTPG